MSILSVHDLQGISAYSNTIRIPSGHNLETYGQFSINGSLKIPVWTTATRPTTNLVIGLIGYNTTTSQIDIYVGGSNPTAVWSSLTPAGPALEFPTAYTSLIDGFAGTKIYVKTTGNDSNAGTSVSSPKQSIESAITAAASGSMIIVYPGTYTNNTSGNAASSSYSGQLITDQGKNLQIVCSPGQVKITGSNSGARDYHAIGFRNSSSKIYGAILERNNGGRTQQYETAFIGFSAGENNVTGQIYNCVFREINSNGSWSMHYDNSGSANWIAEGCLFIGSNWLGNYSGGASTITRFSASNNSSWVTSGTFTGNSKPVSVTSTWGTGSTAFGVYYGTYAWSSTSVTINYA
jgi:hypothetical protein